MDSYTCGALQLPWWTPTYTKTSLKFPLVGEDLQSVKCNFLWCDVRKRNLQPLRLPGEGTGIYLDALVVAVSNQNLASGRGSHSLKVRELSLIPPLCSWNMAKKWIKLWRVQCPLKSSRGFRQQWSEDMKLASEVHIMTNMMCDVWLVCPHVFTLLTNSEDEVVFNGILGFAPWSAQGTASSLGSFFLLAWGLPSSLRTIGGARRRGGIGCRVGCCGGGRGHLKAAEVTARE